MACFVATRMDSAFHFFQIANELNSRGFLAHIVTAGDGARVLDNLYMPDLFSDVGRTFLFDYPPGTSFEDLTPVDYEALGNEIVSMVVDVATTIIVEVGGFTSTYVMQRVADKWSSYRIIYYCTEKTTFEELNCQLGIKVPDGVIFSTALSSCAQEMKKTGFFDQRDISVISLRYRFNYRRKEIKRVMGAESYHRRLLFEKHKIVDAGQIVLVTLGSDGRSQKRRTEELSLLIKCLTRYYTSVENGFVICHKSTKEWKDNELLALKVWAKTRDDVMIISDSSDDYGSFGCCQFVLSMNARLSIDCAWAGLNLIQLGSLEYRKCSPLFRRPCMARYADSVFAFEKIISSGKWEVDITQINQELDFDENWGETFRTAVCGRRRLQITANLGESPFN